MGNTKQKLRKNVLVIGILSAILLSGCSKENVPKEESPMDSGGAMTDFMLYKECGPG